MKKISTVLLCILFLSSCSYYNYAKVSPYTSSIKPESLVFENDTVKITYDFWSKNGAIAFDVYNKLDVPIYFDWKRSAFIPNDNMMSYWQDVTNTVGVANSYSNALIISGKYASKSIKAERISMLPPRSKTTSKRYALIPKGFKAKQGQFTRDNSFLRFRNYLAISTSEQFDKNVFYVDNDFYVSEIIKVKQANIQDKKDAKAFYFTMN